MFFFALGYLIVFVRWSIAACIPQPVNSTSYYSDLTTMPLMLNNKPSFRTSNIPYREKTIQYLSQVPSEAVKPWGDAL